jgi:hypothetical protein
MMQSRREFMNEALVLGAVAGAASRASAASPSSSTRKRDRFLLEPSQQFDLPHRASLAIHCLTSFLDERQDHLPYFTVFYGAQPPLALHIRWDYGDCIGRYIEALKLARLMSGDAEGEHIDAALQRWSERLLGEHGLSWWPDPPYTPALRWSQPRRVAELTWTQRSTLAWLTTQYAVTGKQRYADLGRQLVDGLNKLALWKDGMAYFPLEATQVGGKGDILYPPEGWSTKRMPTAGWFAGFFGTLIWPLARFGGLTGYEPALGLAQGVAEYCLRGARFFRPDGRFYDTIQGHFYARSHAALGLFKLGVVIGNEGYLQMAERVYNHAKEWGTSFGWFPEDLSRPGCETCCITDMIETAIGLALHVDAKYWNDAEQFGRNHLLESQLLRIDWVDEYHKGQEPYTLPVENPDPAQISRDRVMERCLGGFAGWGGVNDWVSSKPQMMGCCHANGTRGLYDLWHYAVTQAGNRVSVNLLFSRATDDVVVKSHLPFSGRVDIQARSDRRIRVRVPDYVPGESLSLEMNGQLTAVRATGGWVQLPPTKKGDVAVVRFALPEREESVHMGYDTYEVQYRGDTVTAISPPGKHYPLYERRWIASPPAELPDPHVAHGFEIDSI